MPFYPGRLSERLGDFTRNLRQNAQDPIIARELKVAAPSGCHENGC